MQRGFLVESLQKAIFTECYVCIFQTDCCRRRGAQEGSRHDWNESQPRVGRMKPNTIQAGREKSIHSFRMFLFLLLLFFFFENQTAHSINLWNCAQGANLQFKRKLLPKTTIKRLRPELFKVNWFLFATCNCNAKKKWMKQMFYSLIFLLLRLDVMEMVTHKIGLKDYSMIVLFFWVAIKTYTMPVCKGIN